MPSRRKFLKSAGAAALGSTLAYGGPTALTSHAADVSGYKALVCIFLLGGLDNYDLLIPYDQSSYDSFALKRQELYEQPGSNRDRGQLLPLNPANAADFGTRQFALPPEMSQLASLFGSGEAAIIGNVGPLIEPTNRQSFLDQSVLLPPRLFSHNDQQATWQAIAPEGAQLGWGGLFGDAVLNSGANSGGPEFTTIASSNVGAFLTGNLASPYQITLEGSPRVQFLNSFLDGENDPEFDDFFRAVQSQLSAEGFNSDRILERDYTSKVQRSATANARYDEALNGAFAFNTAFGADPLGAQLEAVARTISIRSGLFASRQIFFVGLGGFDTHSDQMTDLPGLLQIIDNGLSSFHQAMGELGLQDSVTTFTASDFGRTLAINGDGTDHGWGANHIAVGGAVNGNRIYGDVPLAEFETDTDSGSGRLIPTTAVEEFAAPLGRWFGLSEDEIAAALPGLSNFSGAPLAFI